MKVKELIKFLCDFNPNAEVKIIGEDGTTNEVADFGWSSGDCDPKERDIVKEKYEAQRVHLYTQYICEK